MASATEASQTTELTELERNYLVQVSGAWSLFTTKAASFQAVFSQTWPTNQLLFDALREAGAGTAWVDSQEAVQKLEPPRRFEEDHSLLLATLEEFVRIDGGIGEALDEGDLPSFVLLNTELGLAGIVTAIEVNPVICEAIAGPATENPQCRSTENLPGGDYGLEVEVLMLELEGKIGPRLGVWRPWRELPTEAEFLAVVEEVQPGITAAFQDALDRLAALEPPAELTADHELLIEHLETLLEVNARAHMAVQAQDIQAYEAEVMTGLMTTFCGTRSVLSSDMLLLAHGHFAVPAPCP